ncbi:MAG: tripartite tricarboxylate transporter substrate-binding protein [Burkholderiales bacterium]
MTRSKFTLCRIATLLVALLAAAALPATAQSYPARSLRFLVGGPPGSGADLVSRMLAPKLAERLGQPVVVEQKTGAGGIIANDALAKSPADGHTLALLTGAHPTHAAMRRTLPYDPLQDFSMVGTVVAYPLVVSVVPTSPVSSFPDLLARAKAAPGRISYAMSPGSLVHLAGEWINSEAGTTMLAVPYRGSSAALVDALGGRVDVLIETATAAFPQVRAGKVRPLAVSSATRHPALPDVPTIAETLPAVEFTSWLGLATAPGTPHAAIGRLNAELRVILELPDVRQRIADLGGLQTPSTPEEMRARVEREITRWKRLVELKGIEKQD